MKKTEIIYTTKNNKKHIFDTNTSSNYVLYNSYSCL